MCQVHMKSDRVLVGRVSPCTKLESRQDASSADQKFQYDAYSVGWGVALLEAPKIAPKCV